MRSRDTGSVFVCIESEGEGTNRKEGDGWREGEGTDRKEMDGWREGEGTDRKERDGWRDGEGHLYTKVRARRTDRGRHGESED